MVDFLNLQQGSMTVVEYEAKFAELSRFAPHLVAQESDRVLLFEKRFTFIHSQ